MRIGFTYDHCTAWPCDAGCEETADIAAEYETLDRVCDALNASGHTVVRIGNARDLVDKLAAGERVDMMFNACLNPNQPMGAAQIPAILDAYDIPYTFSNSLTISLSRQTTMMQSLLRENGIPACDATQASNDAEFVVGIIGCGGTAESIGCASSDPMVTPDRKHHEMLQRTALAAWRALECRDAGCVYLRVDNDGTAQVARVEPIPSFNAELSDFIKIADSSGVTLEKLVEGIVNSASSRSGQPGSPALKPPRPHLVSSESRQRSV